MAQEFFGVVYDIVDDVVIERSPVIRTNHAEALQDARELCDHINANADDYDRTVDRDVDAYVAVDTEILY